MFKSLNRARFTTVSSCLSNKTFKAVKYKLILNTIMVLLIILIIFPPKASINQSIKK